MCKDKHIFLDNVTLCTYYFNLNKLFLSFDFNLSTAGSIFSVCTSIRHAPTNWQQF